MMKSKPIAAPFKGGEGDLFRRAASQPGAGGAKKRVAGCSPNEEAPDGGA
jgi:hypothetical protein